MFASVWILLGVVLLVVIVFSIALVHRYSDPLDSSKLTKSIAVTALTVSLLAVLVTPVDVFVISHNVDSNGLQTDSSQTESMALAVKYIYYVIYSMILAFVFGFLPFGYFFYEEEGEHDYRLRNQVCAALKYTAILITVFAVLIIVGAIIAHNSGSSDSTDSVTEKLENIFKMGDSILAFCIGTVTAIGVLGWVTYTAYGLVYLPISLFPTRTERYSFADDDELRENLLKTEGRLQYLEGRKERDKNFSKRDESSLRQLRSDKRRLERAKARQLDYSVRQKKCSCMFVVSYPFRFVLCLVSLGLSLLIISSLAVSLTDKAVNSTCKFSCGFVISSATYPDPLNYVFVFLSKFFPLDYIFFGILALYLLVASIVGLVAGGVRLLCLKIYDIRAKRTPQNALLMGVWFICFVLVAVNIQMVTLLPQYAAFGNQKINGQSCSIDLSNGYKQCVMSQLSQFVDALTNDIPFFGIVYYFAGIFFVFIYLILAIVAVYRYRVEQKEARMSREDSDMDLDF